MIENSKRTLIIDVSNILFRVAAMQKYSPYAKDATVDDLVGMSFHVSLQSIFKYYNKFKPDFLIFAFDGDNNWRKAYTSKNKSRLPYKGNRVRDPEMEHYYRLLKDFRQTIGSHTSICCISIETMEADDVIAWVCQTFASPEKDIYIVSGDKDFTQLLKLPGVHLINPDNGKPRNLPGDKDYEPDIDYWLFKKCVRGDGGDNVPSAFPRVRETKIRKAYDHDYDRLNFMNETWTQTLIEEGVDKDGKLVVNATDVKHKVGDLFEENVILMDLAKQPKEQRDILDKNGNEQVRTISSYSHFQFLRFLEDHQLQRVREDAMKFIEMFTNNQRFTKGEKLHTKVTPNPQIDQVSPKQNQLLNF